MNKICVEGTVFIFLDENKTKRDEVVDKILNEMEIIRKAELKTPYIDVKDKEIIDVKFGIKYKDKEMFEKDEIIDVLDDILINLSRSEIWEKFNDFHDRINEKYKPYCIAVGNYELSFWINKKRDVKKVIRELTKDFVESLRKVIYELISENNRKGLDKWIIKEMTFKL